MLIIYLIQLVLTISLFLTSKKLYEYGDYNSNEFDPEDKIKFPIIAYLAIIIANLVPIFGLVVDLGLFIAIIVHLGLETIYYKPGKIIKFLFKSI